MPLEIASIPRYPLLESWQLRTQAEWGRVSEPAGVRLLAIDRVLRSLAAAGVLDAAASGGWALGGSTALLGVWLPGDRPARPPEELCLLPIGGREIVPPGELADWASRALPDGLVAPDPAGRADRYLIEFRGPFGTARLPLRVERAERLRLSMPRPREIAALGGGDGWLYDSRFAYRGGIDRSSFAVPTALIEEIVFRIVLTLAAGAAPASGAISPDLVFRADDLRRLLLLEREATEALLRGPVRAALVEGLRARAKSPAELTGALERTAAGITAAAERCWHPGALTADERRTDDEWDESSRFELMSALARATGMLREGR